MKQVSNLLVGSWQCLLH